MSQVDWSKAPEWAKKLGTNPHGENAWLGDEGYSYLLGNGGVVSWSYETAFAYTAFQIIETRPVLWTGEGLPPVGVVCEVLWDSQLGIYVAAAVLAHDEAGAVYRFTSGERKGEYQSEQQDYYKGLPKFRPLRTPEQIAAEDRKLQREQLAYLIAGYMGFDDPREVDTKLAAYIFDHDYRKQVAP